MSMWFRKLGAAGIVVAVAFSGCAEAPSGAVAVREPEPAPSQAGVDWLAGQGEAAFRQGDCLRAAQYFEAALEQRPEDLRLQVLLWWSYVKGGRFTDAERSVEQHLEAQGSDLRAREVLDALRRANQSQGHAILADPSVPPSAF